MSTAGYSGTPLAAKLGLKPGMRVAILNPPQDYDSALGPLPDGVKRLKGLGKQMDFVHFFGKSSGELARRFPRLKNALAFDGMLWISWPKKASKVATDLDENAIRALGLDAGLVDVKVAAVDEVWSGLKLVYRVKDRG